MANINRVVLIGNLTADPELKNTSTGTSLAKLRIAVNRRWVSKTGESKENTDFFSVTVWGKLAELCAQYLSKGRPVAIDGRLQTSSWETEDGQKRSMVEIVAENVQFLGSRSDGQGKAAGSEAGAVAASEISGSDIYDDDFGNIELEDTVGDEVPF